MDAVIGRALVILVVAAGSPAVLDAQILSPGPLSAAHEQVEGLRQCTACHQLGQRGVAADRCLSCHEALARRVRAQAGYHATVASESCGSCHREHYGRDFALVRLDTAGFNHTAAGYELLGAHLRLLCQECHRPDNVQDPRVLNEKATVAALERTFLGLSRSCGACHLSVDPHGGQFGSRDCATCHTVGAWTEAPVFDHDRAAYPLTGGHRRVDCIGCHVERQGVRQWVGIEYRQCGACHADPHRGGQGEVCATCHTTDAWRELASGFDGRGFNHALTRFPLRGAHDRLDCGACHARPGRSDTDIRITLAGTTGSGTRFPPIVVRNCRSCHLPAHPGAEPERGAGQDCVACHTEQAWTPASFGSREHATTRFPLDGAHLLLTCGQCHSPASPGRLAFSTPDLSCSGCHLSDSPHGRAYEDAQGRTDCVQCHRTPSWKAVPIPHEAFPLTGGHARVVCASCHLPERDAVPVSCDGCHAGADPHRGRSAGRGCGDCHDATGFAGVSRFDHGTTGYLLEGAHRVVACRACHLPQPDPEPAAERALVLRYSPLPTRCEGCHGP